MICTSINWFDLIWIDIVYAIKFMKQLHTVNVFFLLYTCIGYQICYDVKIRLVVNIFMKKCIYDLSFWPSYNYDILRIQSRSERNGIYTWLQPERVQYKPEIEDPSPRQT